jgi:hypothetical protein
MIDLKRNVSLSATLVHFTTQFIRMVTQNLITRAAVGSIMDVQRGIRMSYENGVNRTLSPVDVWKSLSNGQRTTNQQRDRKHSCSTIVNLSKIWGTIF